MNEENEFKALLDEIDRLKQENKEFMRELQTLKDVASTLKDVKSTVERFDSTTKPAYKIPKCLRRLNEHLMKAFRDTRDKDVEE